MHPLAPPAPKGDPKKSIPPDSPRPRTPKWVPFWSLFHFFRTLRGFWKIELPQARELNFEGPDGPGNHILAFRSRVSTSSPHWRPIPTPSPGGWGPPLRPKKFYGPVWEALRLRLEILAKSLWFGGPARRKHRKPRSGTQRFSGNVGFCFGSVFKCKVTLQRRI